MSRSSGSKPSRPRGCWELAPHLLWAIVGVRTCSTLEDESKRRRQTMMRCQNGRRTNAKSKRPGATAENSARVQASNYDAEKHLCRADTEDYGDGAGFCVEE